MTTTNLTSNEREGLLKQIRERRLEAAKLAWMDHPPQPTWRDIDALLSLLDSQAALRPTGWQSAQVTFDNPRAVKVVFETPACAEAFIDRIEPADGPVIAATRMRDKCVAAVKAMGQQWYGEAKKRGAAFSDKGRLAEVIAKELESLTLDQVEGSND